MRSIRRAPRKTTTIKSDRLSSFLYRGRFVFRDRRETDQSLWPVGAFSPSGKRFQYFQHLGDVGQVLSDSCLVQLVLGLVKIDVQYLGPAVE